MTTTVLIWELPVLVTRWDTEVVAVPRLTVVAVPVELPPNVIDPSAVKVGAVVPASTI